MLTLFKPWRTGKDLKLQNDSWDDAFTTHKFTSNQVQVMKNFNIRYECLDARDDFSVQLKQGGVSSDGLFPQFMTTELLSDLDDDHMQDGVDFGVNDDNANYDLEDDPFGLNKYFCLGKHGSIIKAQMDATENIVRNAGWLNNCPDGVFHIDKDPLEPEILQSAIKWKLVVQKKRQELLDERVQNIPAIKSTPYGHKFYSDPNTNNVMIVDQSYFEYNFKAQDVQDKK